MTLHVLHMSSAAELDTSVQSSFLSRAMKLGCLDKPADKLSLISISTLASAGSAAALGAGGGGLTQVHF